jgi:hypothetical protein
MRWNARWASPAWCGWFSVIGAIGPLAERTAEVAAPSKISRGGSRADVVGFHPFPAIAFIVNAGSPVPPIQRRGARPAIPSAGAGLAKMAYGPNFTTKGVSLWRRLRGR